MATSRKIMTAALAATIAITMLSISSPASAWSRCGRNLGPGYYGMALRAAAPSPYSYGYYGSANPSGFGSYGSGNSGYYGAANPSGYGYYGSGNTGYYGAASSTPVASEGYYCATGVKTCLLREPGWLGTGCSCAVSCGRARGIVE